MNNKSKALIIIEFRLVYRNCHHKMALFVKEKIKSEVVFDNVFRAELGSTSRRDGCEIPFISEIILVSGVRGIQLANNITLPSHKYSAPLSTSL